MVRSRAGRRGLWSLALLAVLGIALFASPAFAEDGDDLGAAPAAGDAPPTDMPPKDMPPTDMPPGDDFPMDVRDDVVVTYGPGPAPGPAPAPSFRRAGSWDLTLGASLTLFEYPSGILGLRSPPAVFPFRWSENDPGAAFGYGGEVGYNYSQRNRLELRGGWYGEYDVTSQQVGRRYAFSAVPGGAQTLSPQVSAFLRNHTEIWQVEGNWWHTVRCSPCSIIDLGIGARYLNIGDLASVNGFGLIQSRVENDFFAGQLMAAWRFRPQPRVEFNVIGKALLGYMMRDMSESDNSVIGAGATPNQTRQVDEFSFGLEGEVSFTYRFTSQFGITASYRILYLDAISRAENVLDFSQAATGSLQLYDRTETTILNIFYVGFRFDL